MCKRPDSSQEAPAHTPATAATLTDTAQRRLLSALYVRIKDLCSSSRACKEISLRQDRFGMQKGQDCWRTCQAVEMVGTAPSLMARTYSEASVASMGPVITCAPSRLGCARSNISRVSCSMPCVRDAVSCGSCSCADLHSCSSNSCHIHQHMNRTAASLSRTGTQCLVPLPFWTSDLHFSPESAEACSQKLIRAW